MSVNVKIREADLKADRDLIVEMVGRYLNPEADERRYDWLYLNNPFGIGRSWIATIDKRDTVIGIASAFPRIVYVGREEVRAWVLGDFCVSNEYRSLGPALALQRACLTALQQEDIAFWYDFPSTKMVAIYQRLNVGDRHNLLRFAKLLKVDTRFEAALKFPMIGRSMATIGNAALKLWDQASRKKGRFMYVCHTGPCGEEFSCLTEKIAGYQAIVTRRNADYLNWRYFLNPLEKYVIAKAYRDGELVGFGVLHIKNAAWSLVDLACLEDENLYSSFISWLVSFSRAAGGGTLSVPLIETHPMISVVKQLGFSMRDTHPVIIQNSPHFRMDANMRWGLMHGDRDS